LRQSYVAEASRIQDVGHLTADAIARATGVSVGTARAWLAGRMQPTGVRAERLVELGAIVDRLAGVIEADYIPIWLSRPVPALNDDKPIDVLAAGEYRRLSTLIAELEQPTAV
jgi:uncharacterized protein (DUF2384 family)